MHFPSISHSICVLFSHTVNNGKFSASLLVNSTERNRYALKGFRRISFSSTQTESYTRRKKKVDYLKIGKLNFILLLLLLAFVNVLYAVPVCAHIIKFQSKMEGPTVDNCIYLDPKILLLFFSWTYSHTVTESLLEERILCSLKLDYVWTTYHLSCLYYV